MVSVRRLPSHAAQWMDTRLFPAIIAYTTHRAHIALLMVLWLGLLIGGAFTAFELVGGNYTNGLSAITACVILLQQISHQRQNQAQHAEVLRRHDEHAARLARLESSAVPAPVEDLAPQAPANAPEPAPVLAPVTVEDLGMHAAPKPKRSHRRKPPAP